MLKKVDQTHDARDIAQVAVPESMLADPDRFGGRRDGGCRIGTLHLREGRVAGMSASAELAKCMVLPKLTEPHVHLDKCHTIERLGPIGGDLSAAVAAQMKDKARWSAEDLETRMRRGLVELARAGCGIVRTHIDWREIEAPPLAWEVACSLRDDAQALGIELQIAALTGIDQMAKAGFAEAVARRIAADQGVLGAFILHHDQRKEGLANCFTAADTHGLVLDFHVDEGLDPSLDGLELIVDTARETAFEGPVLCGHACSLASRTDTLPKVAEGLAECGISVVALPTTNLYLQGRGNGTPTQRGLTMLHELGAAGVNTALGSDNVRDAFCPVGRHDPMNSLHLAVLTAHLDPPLNDHLPMITNAAARALGVNERKVDSCASRDLILLDAPDLSTVLANGTRPTRLTDFTEGALPHG
ncbi:MAG: amidohydrolase family protein [Litoreibacter sp.]|nr:amidohydrolase family protein [Litoreibacter sp.]